MDDKFDDALPTTIDPAVPTGARDRPAQFDPRGRLKDNRTPVPDGAKPVVADVLSALPVVLPDESRPPKVRAPSSFDPGNRVDELSRTKKWAPKDPDAARGAEPSTTEVPTRVEGLHRPDESKPRVDDLARRSKAATQRGHDGAGAPAPRSANPLALPLAAPHPSVILPAAPPRDRSEPMRVISMKTPADLELEDKAQRAPPVVKLRAISEVRQTPPHGMGHLAPPRDPREVRARRVRDNVIWGSVAVILASVVTLAIWFLARR